MPIVDNAIIMAAGTSSRFAPLSYERHKGLAVVRGEVLIVSRITGQLPEELGDAFVVPALHGRAQADADDLGQPAGVYAFHII